jgi:hypothetical protein
MVRINHIAIHDKEYLSLNSLCGISLNATGRAGEGWPVPQQVGSQFPLWDFFECNKKPERLRKRRRRIRKTSLNSLCGISLNATLGKRTIAQYRRNSTLNSLCGISLNATYVLLNSLRLTKNDSQFPLWDFFECNADRILDELTRPKINIWLSIPFVGFL